MLKKLEPKELSGNNYDVDDMDEAVRSRWHLKDEDLEIKGLEKKLIEEKNGFKVYEVDGEWIRNNLDVGFGTGGHGLVHSYIPMDEIWAWPIAENKWSIILHEMIEYNLMKNENMEYEDAHKKTINITKGLDIRNKKEANLRNILGRV